MKIDAQFGTDTGMYLVEVYLESDRECALGPRELLAELRPLLKAEGISFDAVVDFFLNRRDERGEWVSAGMLP